MDPMSIATAAVSLLFPFFSQLAGKMTERIGEGLGDAAMDRLRRLYETVRDRLTGDRFAGEALEGMRQQPESERDQGAVQYALARTIEEDPQFGETLQRLIEEAQRSVGPSVGQVSESGIVALGGDVNLRGTNVAGRDMKIEGGQQINPKQD